MYTGHVYQSVTNNNNNNMYDVFRLKRFDKFNSIVCFQKIWYHYFSIKIYVWWFVLSKPNELLF